MTDTKQPTTRREILMWMLEEPGREVLNTTNGRKARFSPEGLYEEYFSIERGDCDKDTGDHWTPMDLYSGGGRYELDEFRMLSPTPKPRVPFEEVDKIIEADDGFVFEDIYKRFARAIVAEAVAQIKEGDGK